MVENGAQIMTYRNSPSAAPLITCLGGYLVALDAESGAELWSHALDRSPGRVVQAGDTLFLATRGPDMREASRLLIFDARTGALRSETDLGFEVTTAIAHANRVYFGGTGGVVALAAEGAILFRRMREVRVKSAWNGDQHDIVHYDGRGTELGRKKATGGTNFDGMLVLGDLTSQPDFDT